MSLRALAAKALIQKVMNDLQLDSHQISPDLIVNINSLGTIKDSDSCLAFAMSQMNEVCQNAKFSVHMVFKKSRLDKTKASCLWLNSFQTMPDREIDVSVEMFSDDQGLSFN